MNGPTLVCAGCGKPTTMYKPICDDCMRASGQEPRPECELIAEENAVRVQSGLTPHSITIDLTPEQVKLLTPHFDWASEQFVRDQPGMLVAQVLRFPESKRYLMKVGFLDNERAKLLQRSAS